MDNDPKESKMNMPEEIKLVPELKASKPIKIAEPAEPISLSPKHEPIQVTPVVEKPVHVITPDSAPKSEVVTNIVKTPSPSIPTAATAPVRPSLKPAEKAKPVLPKKPATMDKRIARAQAQKERIAKVEGFLHSLRLKFDKNTNSPRRNRFLPQPDGTVVEKKKMGLMGIGAIVFVSGAIFGILPYLAAIVLSPIMCGANANEGNCGVAALPWLMFFTIPVGVIVFLAGLVVGLTGLVKFMVDSYRNPVKDKTNNA